jgi:hypothetical protein
MVEISHECFGDIPEKSQIEVLFETVTRMEKVQAEDHQAIAALAKSPWRMAIPPVSWKYLGLFTLAMAAIIKGDMTLFGKLINALFGAM